MAVYRYHIQCWLHARCYCPNPNPIQYTIEDNGRILTFNQYLRQALKKRKITQTFFDQVQSSITLSHMSAPSKRKPQDNRIQSPITPNKKRRANLPD